MPCPPTLLDADPDSTARPLTVDVAVVGAGAAGAATAWRLARRGLRVALLERRGAAEVWRSAGAAPWTDSGLPAPLAAESAALWRQVEEATGAALLHVNGGIRYVRADQATAALTAAATAWGALLRPCDPVLAVAADGHAVRVTTPAGAVEADRVVLAGAGPATLAAGPVAPVVTLLGVASFAVPALVPVA